MIKADSDSRLTIPFDQPIRLLHVDDNNFDLELTSIKLNQFCNKIEIISTTSGKEAIKYIEDEEIDCIISDFRMPDIDGLELLKIVKSMNDSIPFIFLTGQGNENIAAEALRAGADDYFTKGPSSAHFERLCHSISKHSQANFLRQESAKAKADLIESEKRFRILFEHAPEAIFVVDRESHKILDANENTLNLLKLKHEELLNRSILDFVAENQENAVVVSSFREISKMTLSEYLQSFEICLSDSLGNEIPGEARITSLPSAENNLIRLSFVDLSDRKKAEELSRQQRERFDLAFNNAAVGMALVTIEGIPFKTNIALQEMLGYSAEELADMMFSEFTHPDDISLDLNLFNELISGNRTTYNIDKRYKRKDGKIIWGQLTVSISPERDGSERLIIGMVEDITDRLMAENKVRLLKVLTHKINEAPNLANALNCALDEITDAISWEFGEAWVMDKTSKNLMSLSSSWQELSVENPRINMVKSGMKYVPGKGFLSRLCDLKKPEWISDIQNTDKSVFIEKNRVEKTGFRSVFGMPIVANGEVEAVFVFYKSYALEKDLDIIEFVTAVTSQISSLVERKRAEERVRVLNDEIYDTQKEFIYILGEVVETRSKETANHVRRMAETCYHLSLLAGLGENKARTIRAIAPMHDIGKIGIPDSILLKPGKLTKEEFEFIKSHTIIGYSILKASSRELLEKAAIIALQHHEHWDGNGYPYGLRQEELHVFSRITAIADVFDALSHKRVYKDAWEIEQILQHFIQQKGKQFDPHLVDLFIENIEDFKRINELYKDTADAIAIPEVAAINDLPLTQAM